MDQHFFSLVGSLHPERTSALRRLAAAWVADAWDSLPEPASSRALHFLEDTDGIFQLSSIATTPLPASTILGCGASGVTLFEPFGGLAAGLEMVLRNGIPIQRYLYVDVNPAATAIARHILQQLAVLYGPHLLPPAAYAQTFDSAAPGPWHRLPMDI